MRVSCDAAVGDSNSINNVKELTLSMFSSKIICLYNESDGYMFEYMPTPKLTNLASNFILMFFRVFFFPAGLARFEFMNFVSSSQFFSVVKFLVFKPLGLCWDHQVFCRTILV